MTGQLSLTISAIAVDLSVYPDILPGWQVATATVTAVVRDRLGNPVPEGTPIELSTTEGLFPNLAKPEPKKG